MLITPKFTEGMQVRHENRSCLPDRLFLSFMCGLVVNSRPSCRPQKFPEVAGALQTAADLSLSNGATRKGRADSDTLISPRSFLDPQPSLASDSDPSDRSSTLPCKHEASSSTS